MEGDKIELKKLQNKYFLTIGNYKYEKKGQENKYKDIDSAKQDVKVMNELFKNLNLTSIQPKKNYINQKSEELERIQDYIQGKMDMCAEEKKQFFLFVYYTGHGVQATSGLRSVPADHSIPIRYFNLDQLVFRLAQHECSPTIIAFFDCCRESIQLDEEKNTSQHINGNLIRIYSCQIGKLTAVVQQDPKNPSPSIATNSFVQLLRDRLDKQDMDFIQILKNWEMKKKGVEISDSSSTNIIFPQLSQQQIENQDQPKKQVQTFSLKKMVIDMVQLEKENQELQKKYQEQEQEKKNNNSFLQKLNLNSKKSAKNEEKYPCQYCPNGHQMEVLKTLNSSIQKYKPGETYFIGLCCFCKLGDGSKAYYDCEICNVSICTDCAQDFDKNQLIYAARACPNSHFLIKHWKGDYSREPQCDECQKNKIHKKDDYFSCVFCDYDRCYSCHKKIFQKIASKYYDIDFQNLKMTKKQKVLQPYQQCPNSHELINIGIKFNRICDICRLNPGQEDLEVYNCSECEFDKCQNCYENEETEISQYCLCLNQHPLYPIYPQNPYTEFHLCDICRKDIYEEGDGMMTCTQCDYDKCFNCLQEEKLQDELSDSDNSNQNNSYDNFNRDDNSDSDSD